MLVALCIILHETASAVERVGQSNNSWIAVGFHGGVLHHYTEYLVHHDHISIMIVCL